MKFLTFNINGLRSALKKDLEGFLSQQDPDLILLQEIRVKDGDLNLDQLFTNFPHRIFNFSEKPGYSGTAILSKEPLSRTIVSDPDLFLHEEGRYIFTYLESHDLFFGNLYLPSGTSGDERQSMKIETLKKLNKFLQKSSFSRLILSGDFNLTHRDIDLKNFKGNKEKPGCTAEERELFSSLLHQHNLIDAQRTLYPEQTDLYTWWTYRAGAFQKNVGWRIDYHLISESLKDCLHNCSTIKTPRISDHAALLLELSL